MKANVISTLQNLFELSPEGTSIGSCLQLADSICFQGDTEQTAIKRWPDRGYWIIGRELLLFHCLDLSDVPTNLQLKVIGQKVRQISPFRETGRYVNRAGRLAMIWIWDEARRQDALEKTKAQYSVLANQFDKLSPLPETALQTQFDDGQKHVGCFRGQDIQVWRAAVLQSSHWIPENPQVATLADSCATTPWTDSGGLSVSGAERLAWRSGLAILILVVVFQAGAYAGWRLENSQLKTGVEQARSEVTELFEARRAVRRIQADNKQLNEWLAVPSQISIFADFDELMPRSVEVTAWDYQQGELKITITDENLDNRLYVERLSEGSRFSRVSVEPGADPDSAIIRLEVVTP